MNNDEIPVEQMGYVPSSERVDGVVKAAHAALYSVACDAYRRGYEAGRDSTNGKRSSQADDVGTVITLVLRVRGDRTDENERIARETARAAADIVGVREAYLVTWTEEPDDAPVVEQPTP